MTLWPPGYDQVSVKSGEHERSYGFIKDRCVSFPDDLAAVATQDASMARLGSSSVAHDAPRAVQNTRTAAPPHQHAVLAFQD